MSATAAAPAPPHDAAVASRAADTRPSLARLTLVELRKAIDTRAGFWLLLATAGLTAAVVVATTFASGEEHHTLSQMFSNAQQPAALLLSVVGILLVSSEWSQRSALVTFALVPQRGRVLAAKLIACVVIGLAAVVVCVVLAAIGTAVAAPDLDDAWSLSAARVGQGAVYLVTSLITGAAFGAALLATAPAIVLSFMLPIGWAALTSLAFLERVAPWLDTTRALEPLSQELLSGREWAHAATSLALWMVVPLLIGLWRIGRSEIR